MLNKLIADLKENIVEIKFTKKDGSIRVLKGTLMKKYLPDKTSVGEIKANKDTVTIVWDVENNGFRAFKNAAVLEYSVLN